MVERSSKKQQELLQYLDDFIREHGYGPSYREMMRGLGYKSVSTVAAHVDGLIARGYIRKKDNSARSIEIITLRSDNSQPPLPGEEQHKAWLAEKLNDALRQDISQSDKDALRTAAQIIGVQLKYIKKDSYAEKATKNSDA